MEKAAEDSFGCVVYARRVRKGVDEVLVQWDCSWTVNGAWPAGQVVLPVLVHGRTVGGRQQVLVQWRCTWVPVEHADAGAVEDYEERLRDGTAGEPVADDEVVGGGLVGVVVGDGKPKTAAKKPTKRRRNHGW